MSTVNLEDVTPEVHLQSDQRKVKKSESNPYLNTTLKKMEVVQSPGKQSDAQVDIIGEMACAHVDTSNVLDGMTPRTDPGLNVEDIENANPSTVITKQFQKNESRIVLNEDGSAEQIEKMMSKFEQINTNEGTVEITTDEKKKTIIFGARQAKALEQSVNSPLPL